MHKFGMQHGLRPKKIVFFFMKNELGLISHPLEAFEIVHEGEKTESFERTPLSVQSVSTSKRATPSSAGGARSPRSPAPPPLGLLDYPLIPRSEANHQACQIEQPARRGLKQSTTLKVGREGGNTGITLFIPKPMTSTAWADGRLDKINFIQVTPAVLAHTMSSGN